MNTNYNIFENIDSEDKAYWLGFIIADGTVFKRNTGQWGVKISLKHSDIEHLRKFKQFLNSTNKICTYKVGSSACTEKKYECSEFQISNKQIVIDLEKYGVVPKKTHTIGLPEIREDLTKHMIRGIWDGDGSVLYRPGHSKYPDNYRPEVQLCGNNKILSNVQNIFKQELGIKKSKLSPVSSIFLFRKSCSTAKLICEYLYKDSNIYLNRKYEKALLGISWQSKQGGKSFLSI